MTSFPVLVCLLVTLAGASTLKDVGIVAVNFRDPRVFMSGQTLYVSKDHPHVIRMCVAGDVLSRCFGGSQDLSMRAPGCEIVDSDCTCYRWAFNSLGNDFANGVTVTPHPYKSGCATVVYRPQKSAAASISLEFELQHLRPVVPTGWLYAIHAQYLNFKRRTQYEKPFFSYLYEVSENVCGDEKAPPPGLAYSCKKRIEMNIVSIVTPHPDTSISIYIPVGITAGLAAALVFMKKKIK